MKNCGSGQNFFFFYFLVTKTLVGVMLNFLKEIFPISCHSKNFNQSKHCGGKSWNSTFFKIYLKVGVSPLGFRGAALWGRIWTWPFERRGALVRHPGGRLALGRGLARRTLPGLILEGHGAHGQAGGLRLGQRVQPEGGGVQVHGVGAASLLWRQQHRDQGRALRGEISDGASRLSCQRSVRGEVDSSVDAGLLGRSL